jgi:putative endonuclease
MYYFYILLCADNKRYYGYTNNLKRRFKEHQTGKNISTKRRRPLKVVYYETFDSKDSAEAREKQFKNGRTRKTTIDKLINEFPPELLAKLQ